MERVLGRVGYVGMVGMSMPRGGSRGWWGGGGVCQGVESRRRVEVGGLSGCRGGLDGSEVLGGAAAAGVRLRELGGTSVSARFQF